MGRKKNLVAGEAISPAIPRTDPEYEEMEKYAPIVKELAAEEVPVPRVIVGIIKKVHADKWIERIPVYEDELPQQSKEHKLGREWASDTRVLNDGGAPPGDKE